MSSKIDLKNNNKEFNKNNENKKWWKLLIFFLAVLVIGAITFLCIFFIKKHKKKVETDKVDEKVKEKYKGDKIDKYDKNKLKDNFLTDALDYDKTHNAGTVKSILIDVIRNKNRSMENKRSFSRVTQSNDSIFSLFDLLHKTGEEVAIVAAANAIYVGGGYTVFRSHRDGKGTQEEALMGVVHKLSEANLTLAIKDRNGKYYKDNKGRIKYNNKELESKIWLSEKLGLKVPLDIVVGYKNDSRNCKFISDYISLCYYDKKFTIKEYKETSKKVSVYSMAAFDARNAKHVDYDRLYTDVNNKLITCLLDAEKRKIKHVVLTVPGTGVFANGDKKYLETVKRAAKNAVENYGGSFKNLVVSPKID